MRALQGGGPRDESWIRAVVGIAQLSAGIWLLVLWLVGAPVAALAALVLLSVGLWGFRWWRWGRPNTLPR